MDAAFKLPEGRAQCQRLRQHTEPTLPYTRLTGQQPPRHETKHVRPKGGGKLTQSRH